MHYSDCTLRQPSWTISGRYFGYWEGDDLWTHHGRHVGRLRGAEIFAPDGRYLGEMMGNGRLAVRTRKLGTYGTSYIAWPPRWSEGLLPHLDPGTHRIGYDDFPSPMEFLPPPVQPSGFPASIPC
jgi:hypothetical protein